MCSDGKIRPKSKLEAYLGQQWSNIKNKIADSRRLNMKRFVSGIELTGISAVK